MSQNSKWSSWQQLKPTKQETITETGELSTLVAETVEEITTVEEPIIEIEETVTTEEITPKPVKKRNVNV